MAFNSLSTKQLEAILSTIGQQKSNLKKLNISCNNLSSVDPLLLVRAVSRLEEINLDGTELTFMQARGIMLTIGFDKFSTVQKLVLSDNDLSKVKPDLLAKAVNRLEEVDMTNSQLTLEQVEAILKQSLVSTYLKSIFMTEPFEGKSLDEQIIEKARTVIKGVYIHKTD